ncbi:hypothetical protein [Consotaella aegiceratis]|uniref:hypothetical protein n=1 Tax=Consotaella aegiceratis TaxID=3097961 RepID=UPI002F4260D3
MTTVLRFLFVVLLGFVAACLAAAFALLWPFFNADAAAGAGPIFWIEAGATFFAQTMMVGSTAFIPWAIFMVATELLGVRSLLLHAAAGALGAFAFARLSYGDMPAASVTMALVVAGLVFAMVYWLVAGRAAGRWRAEQPDTADRSEPA